MKQKPLVLSPKNIENVISSMKKSLVPTDRLRAGLLLPHSVKGGVNRSKYKGRGRPRNEDYDRIPFPKYLPKGALLGFEITK
jgi:hypothetical protein